MGGFSIPFFSDFVDGDGEEMFLFLIQALRWYLKRTYVKYKCRYSCIKKHKDRVSVSFWVQQVINFVHGSASDEDCAQLREKAHNICSITPSSLLRINFCSPYNIAGRYLECQVTFTTFKDITHKAMNTFSRGLLLQHKIYCYTLYLYLSYPGMTVYGRLHG